MPYRAQSLQNREKFVIFCNSLLICFCENILVITLLVSIFLKMRTILFNVQTKESIIIRISSENDIKGLGGAKNIC